MSTTDWLAGPLLWVGGPILFLFSAYAVGTLVAAPLAGRERGGAALATMLKVGLFLVFFVLVVAFAMRR